MGKETEVSNTPTDPPAKGPDGAAGDTVLILRPYPVRVGQKITIEGGPRRGDWEIVGVGDRKLRLRCPISSKDLDLGLVLLRGHRGGRNPLAPPALKLRHFSPRLIKGG